MSQFEFVAVLVSVITGLGMVRLLSGVALFVGTTRKPYWVHLLWTWNVFHYLVFFWWFLWRWSSIDRWTFPLFLFVLIYALLTYLLCAVLYPVDRDRTDFEAVFYENRRWFFGLWIAIQVVDIVDTTWKRRHGMSGFGAFDILVWGAIGVCSLVGILTSNRRFHSAWAVAHLILLSTFQLVNFGALRAD